MKYLGVILILCIGVKVKATPVILEDNDDAQINVTLIPLTTETPITLNPASGQTVSAATMPPASAKTDTAPTIQPAMTTAGSLIPVSIVTNEPTTPATIVPIVTTPRTFPTDNPTPKPQTGGFDGASFGGGIALGIGLCVIFIVAFKVYSSRRSGGYKTM